MRAFVAETQARYRDVFGLYWELECRLAERRWSEIRGEITPALREANAHEAFRFEIESLMGENAMPALGERLEVALAAFPTDGYFRYAKACWLWNGGKRSECTELLVECCRDTQAGGHFGALLRSVDMVKWPGVLARVFEPITDDQRDAAVQALVPVFENLQQGAPRIHTLLAELHRKFPGGLNLHAHATRWALKSGRFPEAAALAGTLVERAPDHTKIVELAADATRPGSPARALVLYQRLHELTREPRPLMLRVGILLSGGRDREAVAALHEVLRLYPDHHDAAVSLLDLGEHSPELLAHVGRLLSAGPPATVVRLCVAAVLAAAEADVALPEAWAPAAVARLRHLRQTTDGVGREEEDLGAMLRLWCVTRGEPALLAELFPLWRTRFHLAFTGLTRGWRWSRAWVAPRSAPL